MNQTIRQLTEDLTRHTPVPSNELHAPSYGSPQRDAINSVVDNIIGDICGKISDLRKTLDAIEQQVLEGAAGAKAKLQDHILVCIRVNDEIRHMQTVVDDIKASAQP